MNIETLLVNVLACAAVVPIVALFGRSKLGGNTVLAGIVALWLGLAGLFVATPFLWMDRPVTREVVATDRPLQIPSSGYVGSEVCRNCHPHNHATWHDSYHRTMTQVASEKSVFGDFNNVQLFGKDLTVRLFRADKAFLADMELRNPDIRGVYPVVMTTGSHHMQIYWLAAPNDTRLLILPFLYLKDDKKWIPRHSAFINIMCLQDRPELAVLDVDFGRWSQVCIRCHTTQGRPNPPSERGPALMSQVSEFGISCEACHGPAGEHVRANSNPLRRYQFHLAPAADPTIVNPAKLPHDRSSQVCGQCHSVVVHRSAEAQKQWQETGYTFRPGDDLAADPIRYILRGRLDLMPDKPKLAPDPVKDGSFWKDGMIRASGREYNGLLDTPCYQRGQLSCLSCHEMHQARSDPRKRSEWADDQLRHGMDTNHACLQCHEKFRDAGRRAQHTHHADGSVGSLCYNCHMPYTTYGIMKAIRSHQIDVPSVQSSLDTGRPNACNQCHLDRPLGWTADRLSEWYKHPRPKLSREETDIAASVLWTLRGDAGQRALMAWSFGWDHAHLASGTDWQAPYLAQLLEDRYDAVRYIAQRSLRRFPGYKDLSYEIGLLPEQRAAAHQQALKLWPHPLKTPKASARSVLIDEQGKLQRAEFDRLWKLRDDRPMIINE